MQEDTDIQTAEEAMSWIKDHLMGKNGILATIEQGGAIDEAERRKIGDAFEMIQQAWLGQQVIPKEGAQLLHQITTLIERVEQHIAFSSQRNQEMIDFLYQVNHWIDLIFFPPAAPISEEEAMMQVEQHLLGTPQFNEGLIFGRIDEVALEELLQALGVLAGAWKSKAVVSKLAAYTLISAPWLFARQANLFTGEEQLRFQQVEQQVEEAIIRCLS